MRAGEEVRYYLGGAMSPIAPPRRNTHLPQAPAENPWAIIGHMSQRSGDRLGEPSRLDLLRRLWCETFGFAAVLGQGGVRARSHVPWRGAAALHVREWRKRAESYRWRG